MMTTRLSLILIAFCMWTAGCKEEDGETADSNAADSSDNGGPINTPPPPTVDSHPHPSHGPHEGELIELGNEEYHAELIHDESSVTIYILDAGATEAVPIEASEIHVNLKHDGQPEQFALTADPDEGDPNGQSSRFVSSDEELAGHLDEEDAEPQLVLTIEGRSYRGDMTHSHDHGHSHD